MGQPPSYDSYEANQLLQAGRNSAVYNARKSARTRFLKALAVGALIVLCVHLIARSVNMELRHGHDHHDDSEFDFPDIEQGDIVDCQDISLWRTSASSAHGDSFFSERPPNHASTSFELPADADILYFLSRGSRLSGNVRVQLAEEGASSVGVEVGVWYWVKQALDQTSVCQLHRAGRQGERHGVGIFNPDHHPKRSRHEELYFEVSISLPAQAFYSLEMGFSNFGIAFDDFERTIAFEHLSIKTSNSKITAENLTVERGSLVTHNGDITGNFNSSSELALITSNAKIIVNVVLNSSSSSKRTKLILKTSNGEIGGTLDLEGEGKNSAFEVVATTSNNHNTVSFSSHPNSAPLDLVQKSSNGRVRAVLHPAFEGDFILRTSNAEPSIEEGSPEDPSGHERQRTVHVNGIVGGFTKGRIWWGDWSSGGKGSASIFTSNAPIELDLTGN